MKTIFVTRHNGAVDWAKANGFQDAEMVSHFDPSTVCKGDKVIGTLPIHLAAEVVKNGGTYHHLVLNLPADARGKELSADDMTSYGATVQQYDVRPTLL